MTDGVEWVTLKKFPFFEITVDTDQPVIRNKQTKGILKFIKFGPGYRGVRIGGKTYYVHVIVAEQFVDNDDPATKTFVDHIDRNKRNNLPYNLRWVTPSDNARNKTSHMGVKYEFTDHISVRCIPVEWGKITKDDGYLYDLRRDKFYLWIAEDVYRILHVNKPKNGGKPFVWMQPNGLHGTDRVKCTIEKFREQQKLL